MSLFLRYLKQRLPVILLFLAFGVMFFAVFFLYSLPLKAVGYPYLLCAVIGAAVMTVDFLRVRKRHIELTGLFNSEAEALTLPEKSNSITENDLCELFSRLCARYYSKQSENEDRFRKTSEYYTLWAHQIKTPISSMYLTLYNEDSAESRRLLSDLTKIERYVGMALTYLKLDSETNDFVFRRCYLDEIIKKSVKSFSTEFIYRRLSLDYVEIDKEIVTDEKWFGFVLEQLISNALKYTNEGGVKIYMSEENVLCIQDSGIGISANDLPRIFEQGFTGGNGRRDGRASGIGLYLCRRICDDLNIGLSAQSTPDVGTKVFLKLSQYKQISD